METQTFRLEDCQAKHQQYPDTFEVPTLAEINALKPGSYVKLIFKLPEFAKGRCDAERMWVLLTGRDGDTFHGTLANTPVMLDDLEFGAPIEFKAEHVASMLECP